MAECALIRKSTSSRFSSWAENLVEKVDQSDAGLPYAGCIPGGLRRPKTIHEELSRVVH